VATTTTRQAAPGTPQPRGPQTGRKDLGPLRNLPRSALVSFMQKAAVDSGHRTKIAAFLPTALWGWIGGYLGSRLGKKHQFVTYGAGKENGLYPLGDDSVIGGSADPKGEIRVGLVGDWGTGTDEANAVADRMMQLNPHYTIHLGDVYYVGNQGEVNENCLGISPEPQVIPCTWPVGSVGSFAMNGNHEMYALGDAYFDLFFKALGMRPAVGADPLTQKASYFCLHNDFWQIIALDTGYNSVGIPILEEIFKPNCHLEQENVDWVQNVVSPKGKQQGLILLSHHQYFSGFDDQGNFPKAAEQLQDLIDRPVLWFWGHEHRMTVYGPGSVNNSIKAFGRCIGHGGMPVDINEQVTPGTSFPALVYDHRPYSPPGENITVGMNGFAMLTFKANQLQVDYYDWTVGQGPLLSENWKVENGQLQGISITRGDTNLPDGNQLTVAPDLDRAIGK